MITTLRTILILAALAVPAIAELGQSTSATLPKVTPAQISAQAFSLAGKIVAMQFSGFKAQEISATTSRLEFRDGATVITAELPSEQVKAARKRTTLYVTPIDAKTIRILGDTVAYDLHGKPLVSWTQR